MFNDALSAAIAAARPHQFDQLARAIWAAVGSGAIGDEDASAALESIRTRQLAQLEPKPPTLPRPPRSPDRQASIARRRHLAASGPCPPHLAARFTTGELAALACVASEVGHHGTCSAYIDALAARSGTSRATVQRALRQAKRLGLITVEERRRRGQKSLTNVIRIVSPEWLTWIRIGSQKRNTTQHRLDSAPPLSVGRYWNAAPSRREAISKRSG